MRDSSQIILDRPVFRENNSNTFLQIYFTMNHRVGFVSLVCPKALVDSKHIITQLRAQGYDLVSTYQDAGVVVVNTCGFIESAVEEFLDTIREAIAENGRGFVTGCLGAEADMIREVCSYITLRSTFSWIDLKKFCIKIN